MIYLIAFLVGGAICVLAQLAYDYTKYTPAHVLVGLTVIGAALEGFGLYKPLLNVAGGGALVPVTGFGASITRGVVQEASRLGWEGLFTGVFEIVGLGLATAIILGVLLSILAKPKD
ncbi:MAG TPA: SpoVA/SpoVAEb family sporulation membrane protein [Firmicutes bacterium]|nr:SpoVA/SpoVAEb family sporulation membrane protein [Bacillota bacterium]